MQRIQRKRSLGWRMPPNAKYVGRPTRFGNPYETAQEYRDALQGGRLGYGIADIVKELATYDYLACWCAPEKACHADVLVEIIQSQGGN